MNSSYYVIPECCSTISKIEDHHLELLLLQVTIIITSESGYCY